MSQEYTLLSISELPPLAQISLPEIVIPILSPMSIKEKEEVEPIDPVKVPEVVVSPRIIEPPTTLEEVIPDPVIGFEQTLPPVVIDTAPFVPTVIGDFEGMEELLTELPDIIGPSVPLNPMPIITPQDKAAAKLSSAPPKKVLASSAIKLPSALPSNVKTIQVISLPKIIDYETPPTAKIGPGGLPMDPEMDTLKEIRDFTSQDVDLVNPDAAYQKMIPSQDTSVVRPTPDISIAPLPTIPAITGPTITAVDISLPSTVSTPPSDKGLTPGLPVELKPLTSIPMVRTTPRAKSTKLSQPIIQMPMIKSVAPVPSGIKLPTTRTTILPIPLTSPSILLGEARPSTPINVAHTGEEDLIRNIKNIDVKKLNVGRGRKGSTSYTVAELRAIANSINLPKTGNKKELVSRIKAAVLKVNPHAFDK